MSSDYAVIQKGVTAYANEIVEALGFYPVKLEMDVLQIMEISSQAILFLGLVFEVIIMMFVVLSILLIYSLLLISVESKTFEFGVMRMIGLSKSGIVSMILIQSLLFVLPSLICGFLLSVPTLNSLNTKLLPEDMNVGSSSFPSLYAIY